MLEQVCAYINNHFTHRDGAPIAYAKGEITIENGALTTIDGKPQSLLKSGNYFLIRGSDFNDGSHQYPDDLLTDETFTGTVYKMCPPASFTQLVTEIQSWQSKYGERAMSPYQSEDVIGVYSYQLKSSGKTTGTPLSSWQDAFGSQLKQWRKLYDPAR